MPRHAHRNANECPCQGLRLGTPKRLLGHATADAWAGKADTRLGVPCLDMPRHANAHLQIHALTCWGLCLGMLGHRLGMPRYDESCAVAWRCMCPGISRLMSKSAEACRSICLGMPSQAPRHEHAVVETCGWARSSHAPVVGLLFTSRV